MTEEVTSPHHQTLHDLEQKAVAVAMEAERQRLAEHRAAHADAHVAHERIHQITDSSTDKRLAAMNEFRDQLREQASSFITRDTMAAHTEEFTQRWEANRQRIESLDDTMQKQIERRYEELRALITTEREERRTNEGVKRGMNQTTAVIVGAITLSATVLGTIIVLMNLLT